MFSVVEPQGAASHHRQLARGLFARRDVCHVLVVGRWSLSLWFTWFAAVMVRLGVCIVEFFYCTADVEAWK